MTDDDKDAVLEAVALHVRAGFLTPEEIIEAVDETVLEPGEVDRKWLAQQVAQAIAAKRAEESTWPPRTDCDRLDDLFKSLNDQNIIALQNAGYTQSDGIEDISDQYEQRGGKSSAVSGYCFYHGQDLERAVTDGDLWLTFGDIAGDDAKGAAVGHQIKQAAHQAGFDVDWNGSINRRLLLRGLNWQRRSAPHE